MHSLELPVIEYRPIIEDARQLLGFLQRVDFYQPQRQLIILTIIIDLLDAVGNVRTLHAVIYSQLFILNSLFPCIRRKLRLAAVKGKS